MGKLISEAGKAFRAAKGPGGGSGKSSGQHFPARRRREFATTSCRRSGNLEKSSLLAYHPGWNRNSTPAIIVMTEPNPGIIRDDRSEACRERFEGGRSPTAPDPEKRMYDAK